MAALQNDTELMGLLFEKGANNPDVALQLAARDNRLKALNMLLEESYRKLLKDSEKTMVESCRLALEFGRTEAFIILTTDHEINVHFKKHLEEVKSQAEILKRVVKSGSWECLEKLIYYYENNIPNLNLHELISEDIIETAQKIGNKQCLEILSQKSGKEIPAANAIEFPKTIENTNLLVTGFRSFVEFLAYLFNKLLKQAATSHNFFKSDIAATEESEALVKPKSDPPLP
ncbi:hypothetical protein [Legionella tucsonensis]|nr:hypothetical protein [Legionella tucsonensis]